MEYTGCFLYLGNLTFFRYITLIGDYVYRCRILHIHVYIPHPSEYDYIQDDNPDYRIITYIVISHISLAYLDGIGIFE